MSDTPHLRLIIYDIADNRRRRRVAKILEERAVRVQESAFEARLSNAQLKRLTARLEGFATLDDSIRFYTIPNSALTKCHTIGGPMIADGARFWLL